MDISKFSVNKIRTELWTCHLLSERRCLRKACEWTEDLLFALPEEGEEKLMAKLEKDLNTCLTSDDNNVRYSAHYEHAKMCFELHEYDRSAYILKDHLHDDESRFLHYFAMYKGAEKKRMDLMNEITITIPKKAMLKFNELRDSIERSMKEREPDGWILYIYGLVLHKYRINKTAIDILVKSIELQPNNWSAWYMLSTLIDSKEHLHSLPLPNHLFRIFFYSMIRLDLDMTNDETWKYHSQREIKSFMDKYFKESLFVQTIQSKSSGYQNSEYTQAISCFASIRAKDPYRTEAMEIYSNLLYVKKCRKGLSNLAYEMEKVDPFTSEANSCIANSYSIREQHTKAIAYFTRALKINPDSSNSWTLIGHEFLEMKTLDRALQAYRNAIIINKRDCRAWLGLGNVFESILIPHDSKVPNINRCIYYYSQVAQYRPKDLLMNKALGCIYKLLGDTELEEICSMQANQEGSDKLSKLCDRNVTGSTEDETLSF